MTKEIKELNSDILRITNSVVVYTRDYSKFGGFDGYKEIYAMDIAKELYLKGYRKQSEGEWIRQKGRPEAICSKCGREVVYQVIDNKWAFENFCPHCGAKMKGGDDK